MAMEGVVTRETFFCFVTILLDFPGVAVTMTELFNRVEYSL